jgi:hypothetical protein
MSIPELAEQIGHSPQMTTGTYAHVIRKLKAFLQRPEMPANRGDSSGWIRTTDLTIMSRAL